MPSICTSRHNTLHADCFQPLFYDTKLLNLREPSVSFFVLYWKLYRWKFIKNFAGFVGYIEKCGNFVFGSAGSYSQSKISIIEFALDVTDMLSLLNRRLTASFAVVFLCLLIRIPASADTWRCDFPAYKDQDPFSFAAIQLANTEGNCPKSGSTVELAGIRWTIHYAEPTTSEYDYPKTSNLLRIMSLGVSVSKDIADLNIVAEMPLPSFRISSVTAVWGSKAVATLAINGQTFQCEPGIDATATVTCGGESQFDMRVMPTDKQVYIKSIDIEYKLPDAGGEGQPAELTSAGAVREIMAPDIELSGYVAGYLVRGPSTEETPVTLSESSELPTYEAVKAISDTGEVPVAVLVADVPGEMPAGSCVAVEYSGSLADLPVPGSAITVGGRLTDRYGMPGIATSALADMSDHTGVTTGIPVRESQRLCRGTVRAYDLSGRPVNPEHHRGVTIIVNSADEVTKLWR